MPLLSDLKVIYHLVLKPTRGDDHAARMDHFYAGQENAYDDFRRRLLLGREQLAETMVAEMSQRGTLEGARWCDMGGGTGANLELIADAIGRQLDHVTVVDLASSLLSVAEKRIASHDWPNVRAVCDDATTWLPPEGAGSLDAVTFSYSLTMIPDWFAAIDHAFDLLKSGGLIGVVDFYVSRKYPSPERVRHSWLKRTFWPAWFGCDNVFPSQDHLPYLEHRFERVFLHEGMTRVPCFPNPWFKMPHYIFIGRKR